MLLNRGEITPPWGVPFRLKFACPPDTASLIMLSMIAVLGHPLPAD